MEIYVHMGTAVCYLRLKMVIRGCRLIKVSERAATRCIMTS